MTDTPARAVRITPLGINPKSCEVCGEDKGATVALNDSAHRHAACHRAMRQAQFHLTSGDVSPALTALDGCIGPIDMEDYQ